MIEIIPAVLENNEDDFIRKIAFLPPEADLIHIDVLEQDIWQPIERGFEAHLMVNEPESIFDKWVERGAKRIIAHELIKVPEHVEFGLGVELQVPLEEVYPLLSQVDLVQLMSIAEVGAQGRPLDPKIFDRIKAVRSEFPNITISVDGGINTENYEDLISAGADRLVVGSNFKELWQKLQTKE